MDRWSTAEGSFADEPTADPPWAADRVTGQVRKAFGQLGVGEAVGKDGLPVADFGRVLQWAEQCVAGDVAESRVVAGHLIEQAVQAEVADQVAALTG